MSEVRRNFLRDPSDSGDDWHVDIDRCLIQAGIDGMRQTDILRKVQTRAKAEAVEEYLLALASESKVQRFEVPTKGRAVKIWRATTKMLED